jgi:hypothetical protein
MSKESKIGQVGTIISEGIRRIKTGHTRRDEAEVVRIIKDPSSISDKDVDKYYRGPLAKDMSFLIFMGANPSGILELISRDNTLWDHHREVIKEAERRAKKWKLKPSA